MLFMYAAVPGQCSDPFDFLYQGFSVSESNAAAVVAYIEKQEEHHRKMAFKDEFRLIFRLRRARHR